MSFEAIFLLFPFVLAVHNLDELRGHGEFSATPHRRLDPRLLDRSVFAIAALMLPLAAAVFAIGNYVDSTRASQFAARTFVIALLWNATGHCFVSIWRRKLLPGTITAIGIVVPYSCWTLHVDRWQIAASAWRLFAYLALGAVTVPVAAIVSLWAGYAIKKMCGRWMR